LKSRSPARLTVIGIGTTLVLTAAVVVVLLRFGGGSKAVSDNAALIGALIALGGVFTTQLVNSVLEAQRAQEAQKTEQAQRKRELEVGAQRVQDEALRAYLDQMNRLIIEGHLMEEPENSQVRRLAQAWTLQTLLGLDQDRKRRPLTLIYELDLISKDNPIISLENAELDTADLMEITLHDACLRGADLRRANLSGADLKGSDLRNADLRGANLSDANLRDAVLVGANLLPYDETQPAKLNAPNLLSGVDPSDIDSSYDHLVPTNLGGADLSNADLSSAYLTGAGVAEQQLDTCKSLQGATMTDGRKYEEWLKDKESHGEDE
jgi:uncharacterized protein YjbI with pentapeptide repeats